MKKLITGLWFLFLLSCSHNVDQAGPNTASLRGTILNSSDTQFTLWAEGQEEDSITVDLQNNQFHLTLSLEKPGFFQFEINEEYGSLFLEPGDAVELVVTDAAPGRFDETLLFKGKGSDENNYLAGFYLVNERSYLQQKAVMTLAPDDFLQALSSDFQPHWDFYRGFLEKYPDLNPGFVKRQELEIKARQAIALLGYAPVYKRLIEKDTLSLPENFYDHLQAMDLNVPEALSSPHYTFFLTRYLQWAADNKYGKVEFEKNEFLQRTVHCFDLVAQLIEDETVRCYLYKELVLEYMQYFRDQEGLDSLMHLVAERCEYGPYREEIEAAYQKYAKLFAGRPAPAFSYPDISGKTIALSDFHDRYVYIDIWATWCAPCIAELPQLEALQEQYKRSNIVFISISIDEDREAWETMVRQKSMGGVQLLADQGWQAGVMLDYLIESVPHFMLIGPGGVIVDSGAPRPSSAEIRQVMANLLPEDRPSIQQ